MVVRKVNNQSNKSWRSSKSVFVQQNW